MTFREGLLITAIALVLFNFLIDIAQGDFFGFGQIYGYRSGFTPMSYAYENQEPVFQPEGYGAMGNYPDMRTMGYLKTSIKEEGIPREQLMKAFENDEYDQHLVT